MKAFLQNLTKQLQPFQPIGIQSGVKAGSMADILNLKSLEDQIYTYLHIFIFSILQEIDLLEPTQIMDGTIVSLSKRQCSPVTLAYLQSESNIKSEERPQGRLSVFGNIYKSLKFP